MLTALHRVMTRGGSFQGSAKYWEQRYQNGGTSGSGSYGRLALFKARIINEFIRHQNIRTIMEFGCGDGHQLSLAEYPQYLGLDVSETAVQLCRKKFAADPFKRFQVHHSGAHNGLPEYDLTLSLDVIYHLVEDDVYDAYMRDLFRYSSRFVIIYASNADGIQRHHERMRTFTDWISENQQEWSLLKRIPNEFPYDIGNPDETSQSDFFIYQKN